MFSKQLLKECGFAGHDELELRIWRGAEWEVLKAKVWGRR